MINLTAGRSVREEILSHPQYRRLSDQINRLYPQLCFYQKHKVSDRETRQKLLSFFFSKKNYFFILSFLFYFFIFFYHWGCTVCSSVTIESRVACFFSGISLQTNKKKFKYKSNSLCKFVSEYPIHNYENINGNLT
jgi:hypothetical protein